MGEAVRKKTYVADLSRELYDVHDAFTYSYKADRGLTPEIVREISHQKNEPRWMTEFRLHSLDIYHQLDVPPWGPNLDELDIGNIITYVKPPTEMRYSWDDVPEDIKNTFARLGIPQAEHASLAGVGAQCGPAAPLCMFRQAFTWRSLCSPTSGPMPPGRVSSSIR
jgi:Fe-S cluster assembly protein SufB